MSFLLQTTIGAAGDSTTAATAAAPVQTTVQDSINLFELLVKGGWAMIPITIMSIVAIYLIVERFLVIRKAGKEDRNFMNNIRDFVINGKFDSAVALCRSHESPIARMVEKGLSRIGRPLNDISSAIENVAKLEVYKMEKSLAVLATIAGAAPMMGLIGTVTGMVRTFIGIANSSEGVVIGTLAGGIYEAMVATVSGLVVGVIAYIGYNLLVGAVEKVIYKMEVRSIEFLDLLNEPVN